jgi:hypothetical protein
MLGDTKPVIIRRFSELWIALGVAPAAIRQRSAGRAASLSC